MDERGKGDCKKKKREKRRCFSDCGEDREGKKRAWDSHRFMGEIQASKVTRRWEVGEMSAGSLEEMTKTESYGGNGDKELCKKDWGGAEDTGKFMASVILCSLKYSKEGG